LPASERILKEQSGIAGQHLEGSFVFSEVYGPMNYWDREFLFLGERDDTQFQ